jgi:hypothetical protein
MVFRVSFYRSAEVVGGLAPRHKVDVEANTLELAKQKVAEPGVIIRRVSKAPSTPIQSNLGFINVAMKSYLVSFYRKAEVVSGRAPRHMVSVEADTVEAAKLQIAAEPGVVIRSAYKINTPVQSSKPSYVFETSAARTTWYSNHKSNQKQRLCHECKSNEVERYKRICKECLNKRNLLAEKTCPSCGETFSTRGSYCDTCSVKRKELQEKAGREKRATQTSTERIRTQIAWAQDQLKTTTLSSCKFADRFQGLRLPHTTNKNKCQSCLQKFIDVQTVYLASLLAEEVTREAENANSLSHAAGV